MHVTLRGLLAALASVSLLEASPVAGDGGAPSPQSASSPPPKRTTDECIEQVAQSLSIDIDQCRAINDALGKAADEQMKDSVQPRRTPLKKRAEIAFPNNATAQSAALDVIIEMEMCLDIFPDRDISAACVSNVTASLDLTLEDFRKLRKVLVLGGENNAGVDYSAPAATVFPSDSGKQKSAANLHPELMACWILQNMPKCLRVGLDASRLTSSDMGKMIATSKQHLELGPMPDMVKLGSVAFNNDADKVKACAIFQDALEDCSAERNLAREKAMDTCFYRELKAAQMEIHGLLILKKELQFRRSPRKQGVDWATTVSNMTFPDDAELRTRLTQTLNRVKECHKRTPGS